MSIQRRIKNALCCLLLLILAKADSGVFAAQRSRWGLAWSRLSKPKFQRFGFLGGKKHVDQTTDRQLSCLEGALGLRCGANEARSSPQKINESKEQKVATKKTGTRTAKRSFAAPDIFQLIPLSESSTSSSSNPLLQVRALLTDRVINWKILSRGLLGALFCLYLRQCNQTAGIPRRQAIWSLLKSKGCLPSSGSDEKSSMPASFQPTPFEVFLAEALARTSRDMIPPSAMPSGPAFIGALLSCLSWILITVLLPHWLLPLQVWYVYHLLPTPRREQSVKGRTPTAVLVEVAPPLSRSFTARTIQGKQVVCKLHTTSLRSQMEHGMPPFYFEHSHRRYYYDPQSNQCWDGGPNLTELTVGELTATATKNTSRTTTKDSSSSTRYSGLLHAPSQLLHAQDRWYAYNHQTSVPIPTIRQALWERLKSPLVVIQLIGKVVAVLEDGKAAILALAQTVLQHYHNGRSIVNSSKTLQKDVAGLAAEFATQLVWIHRAGGWKLMEASNLLPGDLFLLTSSSSTAFSESKDAKDSSQISHLHQVVPVDALVMEGMCVTMEAVLTGESVPQTKMPFDSTMDEWDQKLDMMGTHRSAIVFAGTSILHCMAGTGALPYSLETKTLPQTSVLCLALRTGSYSSKGELINALAASQGKTGAATISNAQFDRDSLRLIAIMSFLSTLACGSLFLKPSGLHHHKVSGFRRLIQCTRIATACIPSDLPLSLFYVLQYCANALRQEADVVCSQPGALLTSAEVDTVVFDKTGTLTADTQSLSKVVLPEETSQPKAGTNQHSKSSNSATQQSTAYQLVLAGCHSLVHLEEEKAQPSHQSSLLVGDPLELAALNWLGWSFVPEGGYFQPPANTSSSSSDVEKLWQLKVFPFSPRVRLSSALCLAKHVNGKYTLWALVKGAPEAVERLLMLDDLDQGNRFVRWYHRRVKKLEAKGFRTLAMASREVQTTDVTASRHDGSNESEILANALRYASTVHRSDLETTDARFCGLACFDAKVRPSSRRIIRELKQGKMNSIMLTGDSLGAAVAVATKVGILEEKSDLALLERRTSDGNGSKEPELQWRLTSSVEQKGKILKFTNKTISAILKKAKRGELAMLATGTGLMSLIAKHTTLSMCQPLMDNLGCFSVVARASPECKESFVGLLSNGNKVLMCGDGVNDVSAMKEADVSVALLNGFGTESEQSSEDGRDIQDERRKQRLQDRRKVRAGQAGGGPSGGSSSSAAAARIQRDIEAVQEKITARALARHGMNATSSEPIPYTWSDLKEMLLSVWSAAMEERRRARKLREGGGEAASILVKEDILMQNGTNNTSTSIDVRPGEACMASPFSCLRSSIDGVEAVLRAGVATAACTLSVQQKMALNLLMTCFNLSALYRDGFRYGKNMALVESVLYIVVEQVSFRESCKMRPRLPSSKQQISISLFDSASLISVISKAVVHLVLMQVGLVYARDLEIQSGSTVGSQGKAVIRVAGSQTPKIAALLETLMKDNASKSREDKSKKTSRTNFLGQPRFVPNYESNVVFTLSLLQGTLTTLLMHKGAPFYVGILESRPLCLWSGLSIIFAIACVLETFPVLNGMLELRPWTAQKQKVFVLCLALFDAFACSVIEWYCHSWVSKCHGIPAEPNKRETRKSRCRTAKSAADLEEQVLQEESRKNGKLVLVLIGVVVTMALDATLKAAFGGDLQQS